MEDDEEGGGEIVDEGDEEIVDEGDEDDEQLPEIRSRNCDNVSLTAFVSRTERRVDLYWINYQGERVKYTTLEPGDTYMVSTYETHPWILRDADTGVEILANYGSVYMPRPCDENHPVVVVPVTIPVYRLLDRCVEEISKAYEDSQIGTMAIPGSLKLDVLVHKMNRNIAFELYEPEAEPEDDDQ